MGNGEVGTASIFLWTADPTAAAPQVTLVDAAGNAVPVQVVPGGAGVVEVRATNLVGNKQYALQVRPAAGTASGATTDFDLTIDFRDTFSTATPLTGTSGSTKNTQSTATGSLLNATDNRLFTLSAPKFGKNEPGVLTVTVWGLEAGKAAPEVRVYDKNRNPVSGTTLLNADGQFVLRLSGLAAGETYFVEVTPPPGGDFSQAFRSFPTAPPSGVGIAVRMTIYDAQGNVMATLVAPDGSGNAGTTKVALPKGTYSIHFSAMTSDGSVLPAVNHSLTTATLTDPIRPEPVGNTTMPTGGGTTPTNPGYTVTTPSPGTYAWLNPTNPYTDPWWSPPPPAPAVWTNPVAVYGSTGWKQ